MLGFRSKWPLTASLTPLSTIRTYDVIDRADGFERFERSNKTDAATVAATDEVGFATDSFEHSYSWQLLQVFERQ